MRELEREIQTELSSDWRRIWIERSRLGSVCITLFPVNLHEGYTIVTRGTISDFSVDSLIEIIREELRK